MTDIAITTGTQLRFCVAGSFSPADPATDHSIAGMDDVLLTQASLGNNAARQSSKADLGSGAATWAQRWALHAAVDFTGETPSANGRVDYYWAPSTHATAANGNIAGNSGVDGAAPDGALGSITLDEFLLQCIYIGSLRTHDGAVVQNGFVGYLVPPSRYGQLIVVNQSGDVLEADDVENAAWLTAMLDQVA